MLVSMVALFLAGISINAQEKKPAAAKQEVSKSDSKKSCEKGEKKCCKKGEKK